MPLTESEMKSLGWIGAIGILILILCLLAIPVFVSKQKEDRVVTQGVLVYHRIVLQSGYVVFCKEITSDPCGLKFSQCQGGKTYFCQTNVEVE